MTVGKAAFVKEIFVQFGDRYGFEAVEQKWKYSCPLTPVSRPSRSEGLAALGAEHEQMGGFDSDEERRASEHERSDKDRASMFERALTRVIDKQYREVEHVDLRGKLQEAGLDKLFGH
eukprot:1984890-Karenia_brevis.AAC.1